MSSHMRVYVAGPMTGYQLDNWPAFEVAGAWLRRQHPDWTIILPTELDLIVDGFDGVDPNDPKRPSRRAAMMRDQVIVGTCTHLFLLHNWSRSKGARAEVANALACGLGIMYESGAERIAGVHLDGGSD